MDAPKCRLCGERHWHLPCPALKTNDQDNRSVVRKTAKSPDRPADIRDAGSVGGEEKPSSAGSTKRGRPLAKDKDKTLAATKPWLAEGMSRVTWYRRKAEKAKGK